MAQPKKTAAEIITAFELQVSDITELSSSEELALLNKKYIKICSLRPWEFLKTTASGTILSDTTGYYITVPSDFGYFAENNGFTNNAANIDNNASPKVIFVGTTYSPYQIVNFSDRRQYRNQNGFAYYDAVNNIIRFTGTPVSTTYEFDYIKVPAKLITTDYPIFPGQFHDMIVYAMATDNDIVQLSPKATSYIKENNALYESDLEDMFYWNASLILN